LPLALIPLINEELYLFVLSSSENDSQLITNLKCE